MSSAESGPLPQSSPFWTFSLGYYRGAGVSEACLELQDNCGVDVNVVLFLLWMASSQQRQVGTDEVRRLADKVRPWQVDVIGPIRTLRRRLKSDAPLLDKGSAELFRTRIKAVELESERLQQEAMYALASGIASEAAPSTTAAARASITAYQQALGRPLTPTAIDTLIGALK
ncbi:MAG TPA: TIGR02444 family protein [Xanthobacteraceae bacterium]|nr:TIGR02444 family protein [Xanthobacteraceae bacterium]